MKNAYKTEQVSQPADTLPEYRFFEARFCEAIADMRLTIIFITACCISLFSYASPCSRCKKEPDACTCFRTHSSLSPQRLSHTHHPVSFEAPSLDGSDSDDAPSDDSGSGTPPCQTVAQNPSAIATGKINTISCADTGDKNLVVLNNDGTPATNEPLGLYGRCVNRKKQT